MDRMLAQLNIEHYRKLLTQEMEEAERQTILRLLAEEEVKFAAGNLHHEDMRKSNPEQWTASLRPR